MRTATRYPVLSMMALVMVALAGGCPRPPDPPAPDAGAGQASPEQLKKQQQALCDKHGARVANFAWAARAGRLDTIDDLERKIIDCFDGHGRTALNYACLFAHLDTVKLLVENGADIHLKDEIGYNAVAWAASGGSAEVVRYLLSKGADRHTRDNSGRTLLHIAASLSTDESAARLLLRLGLDPNAQSKTGNTPLFETARNCLSFSRELVLKHGARVNHKNRDGVTPLMVAVLRSELEIVRFFLDRGADMTARDKIGKETALLMAIRRSEYEIAKLLVEHGADVRAKDAYGSTAMEKAQGTADEKRLIALLEKAARERRSGAPGETQRSGRSGR